MTDIEELTKRVEELEVRVQKLGFSQDFVQFTLDEWAEKVNAFAKTMAGGLTSWVDALEEHEKQPHRGKPKHIDNI